MRPERTKRDPIPCYLDYDDDGDDNDDDDDDDYDDDETERWRERSLGLVQSEHRRKRS